MHAGLSGKMKSTVSQSAEIKAFSEACSEN